MITEDDNIKFKEVGEIAFDANIPADTRVNTLITISKQHMIESSLVREAEQLVYPYFSFTNILKFIEKIRLYNTLLKFKDELTGLDIDEIEKCLTTVNYTPSNFLEHKNTYEILMNAYSEVLHKDYEIIRQTSKHAGSLDNLQDSIKLLRENLDANSWRMAYNFVNILLNEERQKASEKPFDDFYLLKNTGQEDLEAIGQSYEFIIKSLVTLYAWQDLLEMIGKAIDSKAILNKSKETPLDSRPYTYLAMQSEVLARYITTRNPKKDWSEAKENEKEIYIAISKFTNLDKIKRTDRKKFNSIYRTSKKKLLDIDNLEGFNQTFDKIKESIKDNFNKQTQDMTIEDYQEAKKSPSNKRRALKMTNNKHTNPYAISSTGQLEHNNSFEQLELELDLYLCRISKITKTACSRS
ncbi:hypothetical protein ACQV2S_02755 [Facklamia sp. P13064]|uniref:hypothetical protein n=1 Tax=Facklamia sp. P13064 TaxID=3421953 RepID=UPI003D179B64